MQGPRNTWPESCPVHPVSLDGFSTWPPDCPQNNKRGNVRRGFIVVLDVGKSLTKLTLWSPERRMVDRRTRANQSHAMGAFLCLDTAGIAAWLEETLSQFARQGDIAAIIPVGARRRCGIAGRWRPVPCAARL